jgi:hypothetical protein
LQLQTEMTGSLQLDGDANLTTQIFRIQPGQC